jgi:LysR family nitrogen assimilation transcriptional regulator
MVPPPGCALKIPALNSGSTAFAPLMKTCSLPQPRRVSSIVESGGTGELAVGLIPGLTRGILPVVLHQFFEDHPYLNIRIEEAFANFLTRRVLDGELDFAIVTRPPLDKGLRMELLAKVPVVLLSGPGLGLKTGQPVDLADLGPLKLVTPSRDHSLRSEIDLHIHSGAIPVARILEMDGFTGMLELARHGDWASLLPGPAFTHTSDRIGYCINPVVAPRMDFEYWLIERSGSATDRAGQLFLQSVRDEIARHTTPS